ncbi:hypothetical protein POM88_053488 [Heracleum sosnowskyi]|uniref:Leucine-rich repeat-containing N-terminal plant-type domain-containing protein n=1 Tax=Heracleum sosnowskyi TaxID=360622 RepID=A0AAD8GPQ7_9APIA|nr:hypothetical protein POM88_053488 [Heracleum sosnowskyi]
MGHELVPDAKLYRISLTLYSNDTKWTANGGDPCGESWRGITCSCSKVTEIKLSGLGLTGSMGYQLTNLKSVTTFALSNSYLGTRYFMGFHKICNDSRLFP